MSKIMVFRLSLVRIHQSHRTSVHRHRPVPELPRSLHTSCKHHVLGMSGMSLEIAFTHEHYDSEGSPIFGLNTYHKT